MTPRRALQQLPPLICILLTLLLASSVRAFSSGNMRDRITQQASSIIPVAPSSSPLTPKINDVSAAFVLAKNNNERKHTKLSLVALELLSATIDESVKEVEFLKSEDVDYIELSVRTSGIVTSNDWAAVKSPRPKNISGFTKSDYFVGIDDAPNRDPETWLTVHGVRSASSARRQAASFSTHV